MSDNHKEDTWPAAFAVAARCAMFFGIIYAMAQCAAVRP